MGKKLAVVGSDNCYHLGSKAYLVRDDGLYHSAKKIYKVKDGVYRLVFGGGVDVGAMVIGYSAAGGMQDAGVVTMGDGKQYRLLTLTKSGTLTVPEEVQAEVWMCGGGVDGIGGDPLNTDASCGGAGSHIATGALKLAKSNVAVIGAGNNGLSSFGGLQNKESAGKNGGTGGGGLTAGGTGDGVDKHPFADSVYFPDAHCGGGAAGATATLIMPPAQTKSGGNGGTNGGSGKTGTAGSSLPVSGGVGGVKGGGSGGNVTNMTTFTSGQDATFYGSGGGGGALTTSTAGNKSSAGGAGYQGVIYIRIPVEQAA